jgi:hypothetical protein
MSTQKTRLEDVDYYLPLCDEDGDLDHEAYYQRNQLAQGRDFAHDFGLTGVSDYAAVIVRYHFPDIDVADVTAAVRKALIDLGLTLNRIGEEIIGIDRGDPEVVDPDDGPFVSIGEDELFAAIANVRKQIAQT